MKVLSLFDGISCGRVAFDRAGIPVETYHAFEIEPSAIQISKKNYPSIVHQGDVTVADFTVYKDFDILIGGSPCQSLSIVRSQTRQHLDGKSRLFFEYVRAKEEMTPKWFLFENVASMNEKSRKIISDILGVQPVFIDSADFSAQSRPRLYWTNIPVNLSKIKKNTTVVRDILLDEVDDKYWLSRPFKVINPDAQVCARIETDTKLWEMNRRIFNPNHKMHTLVTSGTIRSVLIGDRARKLTPVEYERLQTLPDGYTDGISNNKRYQALGNGWTVDVIAWILSQIPRGEGELEEWMR